MTEYNAGEAFLQIVPSFRGVVAAIEREAQQWGASAGRAFSDKFNDTVRRDTERAPLGPSAPESSKRGQESGGKFADGFKARLTAALRSLPDVGIGVATTEAEQKLKDLHAELLALSNQRVGIDIDEASALAKIKYLQAELTRLAAESPSASVRMDTAAASAELAKLRAEIERATGQDQGQRAGGKFAEGFAARVTAALKSLPDVKIGADSTAADVEVAGLRAQLADLSGKTIGVDIDEGAALAQLAFLQAELVRLSTESPSVQVRMDTAAAAAELAKVRADIDRTSGDVDVDANTGAADGKLAATHALVQRLAGNNPNIEPNVVTGPALASIAAISLALAGLTAGAVITPVIGGLAAMLGPLTAAVGGVAGVGAAALPGLSAVKEAYTAQEAAAKNAEHQADQTGKAQAAAANQVKAAQMSLADTERRIANDRIATAQAVTTAREGLARAEQQAAEQVAQAEERVVSAEQALAGAQRASLAAQQALTDARERGRRSLEDQANAAKDAGLQLKADELAVRAAQDNLNRVNKDAKATDLQRQQAALALAQAQQRLAEQHIAVKRVTEDNNKAQKAGVAGSPEVVAANERIAQAQAQQAAAAKNLQDARDGQAKAQQAADQTLADAERSLANARRTQSQRAAQDASDLTRAQMAVAQAQFAASNAADSNSAATRNLAYAMGQLTPQEHELLKATNRFKESFTGWARDLEPKVLPLFTGGLDILGDLLPKLTPLIEATAGALGKIEDRISKAVSGPGFTKFMGVLTDMIGPTLDGIADVAGSLGGTFANVMEAFAPLSDVVIGGLADLAQNLEDASKSPALKAFADVLVALAPDVTETIDSLGGLSGKLIEALAPLSGPALDIVDALARGLSALVDDLGEPLQQMFDAIAPILDELISTLLPPLTTFLTALAGQGPALAQAFADLVIACLPLLPILAQMLMVVAPLVEALAPFAPYLVAAWAAGQLLVPVLAGINLLMAANPITLVVGALAGLALGLLYAYNHSKTFHDFVDKNVLPVLSRLWDYLKNTVFPILKDIAQDAIAGLVSAFETVSDTVAEHRGELTQLVNGLKAVAEFIVEKLLPLLGPVIKAAFELFGQYVASGVSAVAGLVTSFDGMVKDAKTGVKAVTTVFGEIKTAVSDIWDDVQKRFVSGVNYVTQKALNPLIGILNKVLGPFGIDIDTIDPIVVVDPKVRAQQGPGGRAVATGGVLPGWTPGRDVHRFFSSTAGILDLSGGEGILRPEVVRDLGGAPVIDALNARYNGGARGGGRAFAEGGVLGFLGGITDKVRSGAAGGAIRGLNVAEAPIRALIDRMPDGFAHTLASGILRKLNAEVAEFIRGTAKKVAVPTAGFSGSLPTGVHMALINKALSLAGAALTPRNQANVNLIVQRESGWNPNAINLWDSNAKAGHPSQGLMQTIPTTFAAYALPGLGGITDPLANLVAGIRYAISRYGSLDNVPGVRGVSNGSGYVGYDSGGYLPPGVTTVFNGTGRPEPVFTQAQFAVLASAKATENRSVAPSEFRGDLFLDSGEFLGVVRGQVDSTLQDVALEAGRML